MTRFCKDISYTYACYIESTRCRRCSGSWCLSTCQFVSPGRIPTKCTFSLLCMTFMHCFCTAPTTPGGNVLCKSHCNYGFHVSKFCPPCIFGSAANTTFEVFFVHAPPQTFPQLLRNCELHTYFIMRPSAHLAWTLLGIYTAYILLQVPHARSITCVPVLTAWPRKTLLNLRQNCKRACSTCVSFKIAHTRVQSVKLF